MTYIKKIHAVLCTLLVICVANQSLGMNKSTSSLSTSLETKQKVEKNLDVGLLLASSEKGVKEVSALIKLGANPNAEDELGYTPLLKAVMRKEIDEDVVALLAQQKDSEINMALGFAANRGCIKCVKTLLMHKADPNSKTSIGYTPLMLAVLWGHSDVAWELIGNKADIHIKDNEGLTALDYVYKYKNRNVWNIWTCLLTDVTED